MYLTAQKFVFFFPLGVSTAEHLPLSHCVPSSPVTPTLCISSVTTFTDLFCGHLLCQIQLQHYPSSVNVQKILALCL